LFTTPWPPLFTPPPLVHTTPLVHHTTPHPLFTLHLTTPTLQMVCCSRPWPSMSHQQIFAVVSCNSACLPWPDSIPCYATPVGAACTQPAASVPEPPSLHPKAATAAAVATAPRDAGAAAAQGAVSGTAAAAPGVTFGANPAAAGATSLSPCSLQTDAVSCLGGAAAAATAASTYVPPELVQLGKACLSHDRHDRPSAAEACSILRGLLARLQMTPERKRGSAEK